MELKDVSQNLMAIWTVKIEKVFKLGVEGTISAKIKENRMCTFRELAKEIKKVYGLGKDIVFMDHLGEEYSKDLTVYYNKKNDWIGRQRFGRKQKYGKIIGLKIPVENNGAETIIDTKIYTLWNREAMSIYLSIITDLKNRRFDIWINGIIWDDNWSIGSKKPTIIKAVPNQTEKSYKILMIMECANLNIHVVLLRSGNEFINLSCTRNVTLVRAIVLWCLLGINIPPFDYVKIDGRIMSNYEYNVETIDLGHGEKTFILENVLKGGKRKISDEKRKFVIATILKYISDSGRLEGFTNEDGEETYLGIMRLIYNELIEGIDTESLIEWLNMKYEALSMIGDIEMKIDNY
jgi:hypothetical protein